jgi:hypothetical protein
MNSVDIICILAQVFVVFLSIRFVRAIKSFYPADVKPAKGGWKSYREVYL